jgi:uncharacterized coiled-coil DUF342 family protein
MSVRGEIAMSQTSPAASPLSPELLAKLRRARRRLSAMRFLSLLPWTLAACLLAGAATVAFSQWFSWGLNPLTTAGVALGVGLLSAGMYVLVRPTTDADAAATLDSVCGLKERIGTLLALSPEQQDSPAAVDLRVDVAERTAKLEVAEKTPIALPRYSWAPAMPLALLVGAAFLAPLTVNKASAKSVTSPEERKQVVAKTESLAKKIAERQQKEKAADPELQKELKHLTGKIDELSKELDKNKSMNPQDAVLKLSNLSKSLEDRRKQYDSLEKVKSALAKIPNLKDGPAEKVASALKQGDFKSAAEQMAKLREKALDKKLSAEDRKQLANQLNQLQKSLKELANLQKREEELRKNITDKKQLEQALAKLAEDKKKLEQLQKIAEKLAQCAKCAEGDREKSGGKQAAPSQMSQASAEQLAKEMKEAADMLEQMANSAAAREMLNEMLDDLSEARSSMMDGMRNNQLSKGRSMFNKGGVGMGERDESPDDTKSRLRKADILQNKGRVFATGLGEGKSFKGETKLTMKDLAVASGSAKDESVTRQRVPREYQDHAREYFELLEKAAK